MVGDAKFEIPAKVIETFSAWNVEPFKNQSAYDKLMIEALLLIFVTPEDMRNGVVDEPVRQFILDLLKVRTDNEKERISKLDEYIAGVCKEKAKID